MNLVSQIIKKYGIEEESVTILRETAYNSVYQIGEQDKKILRIGSRVSSEDINFELDILDRLNTHNVPVVRWNKTLEGKNFVKNGNSIAVLFDYVNGYHPLLDKQNKPADSECRVAGRVLAQIHNATENYISKNTRRRTLLSEFERVIANQDKFSEYIGGSDFVEQVKTAFRFGQSYSGETVLIHNDYRVDNIFFKNKNDVSAVIDFDWSCTGPRIKDVAHSILVWSFPDGGEEHDSKTVDQFMLGYNEESNVRIDYDENFINWVKFSALADTATYFCDRFDELGFEKRINRSYMYKKFLYFSNL